MTDVPTCLHKTYDITTPSGNGGDPQQARINSQAFNAAYAIVHAGMKDLGDINPTQQSLLFFYHTHCSALNDRKRITTDMLAHFWQNVDSKGMHEATLEKIPKLISIVLDYSKAHITGAPEKKEAIAQYLGIAQDNWYRKGKKSEWNEWFEMLIEYLAEHESDGLTFMYPYCAEVKLEKKRVKSLAVKSRTAWEAIA